MAKASAERVTPDDDPNAPVTLALVRRHVRRWVLAYASSSVVFGRDDRAAYATQQIWPVVETLFECLTEDDFAALTRPRGNDGNDTATAKKRKAPRRKKEG